MSKSSRRRKLDRAKRQTTATQKRIAAQRRRATDELMDTIVSNFTKVLDPDTPVGELARLIDGLYRSMPVPAWLVPGMLSQGHSVEQMTAVAEALLAGSADDGRADDRPRPTVTALTFAAAAARAAGDAAGSRRLLDQALAATEEPDDRLELVDHLRRAGRVADALDLFEARLREAPEDSHAARLYGEAIEAAFAEANRIPRNDGGGCPCGLGANWQDCCEPRERAALSRFGDRRGLADLRDAVMAWLADSEHGAAVDEQVAEALPSDDDLDWEYADRAGLAALLAESALLTARPDDDENDAGDDPGTPLAAFAADPATPTELARRATAWREHAHYGLWRIDSPAPEPGLWCTEIVSGFARYVEFPAEIATAPRWAVWLGAMVPVDGIWRCTGVGMRLSPAEADAVAELVGDAAEAVVSRLTGEPLGARPRAASEPMRFRDADPRGVLVDIDDPASPEVARLLGLVTSQLLPRIATEVHAYRTAPPALRNTDGDPMCLITARIAVSDGPLAAQRLAGRAGFEPDPDDPGNISWYGLQIPEEQAKAMMAEAMARLSADGPEPAELAEPDGPHRWLRGMLRVDGDQIVAEVNSEGRLARLVSVLERIGVSPSVIEETRIDPAQDLPWAGGERAVQRGAVPAADGWEKSWLDEPVPALRGRTPRQAANGGEQPLLEALLRQWEYEADLLAAEGKQGVDTDWLRQELEMGADD